MERTDQGSPLPADPAGREDIMSDEQAGREGSRPDEPDEMDEMEGGTARAAGEGSPMSPDPARREDVIREDVIRDAEQPGDPAAGG